MKKICIVLLLTLTVSSLAGCGAPSDQEIKTALEDGIITMEDAKDKGWIDDAWIEANYKPIEAGTKIHLFDEFDTTYLDGSTASSNLIAGKMCLVFFNTEKEQTMEKLKVFQEISAEMGEIGVPVLAVITDKDPAAAKEKLADMPFPIIVYNEEMQTSLTAFSDMLDGDVVCSFTKDGGFYSAWNSNPEAEDLLSFARSLADEE